jgi:hypothetical protein
LLTFFPITTCLAAIVFNCPLDHFRHSMMPFHLLESAMSRCHTFSVRDQSDIRTALRLLFSLIVPFLRRPYDLRRLQVDHVISSRCRIFPANLLYFPCDFLLSGVDGAHRLQGYFFSLSCLSEKRRKMHRPILIGISKSASKRHSPAPTHGAHDHTRPTNTSQLISALWNLFRYLGRSPVQLALLSHTGAARHHVRN